MIPLSFENANNQIIISTGNVLSVNKKAGQKPTEELIDCLQITFKEPVFKENEGEIYRSYDDLREKINEHERNSIKIGAKLFLNTNSVEYLNAAVKTLLKILNVDCIDNLILAYHPFQKNQQQNGDIQNGQKDDLTELNDLKFLWKELEKFAESKMICQLGIADLDTDTLKALYEDCKIPPTITQINLAACCVVPPSLQEFCNAHDIQLLTHSDPEVILSQDALNQLDVLNYEPTWTIRYQVHVKCRGLLTAKGFVVGANRRK